MLEKRCYIGDPLFSTKIKGRRIGTTTNPMTWIKYNESGWKAACR
jgi:hypothetical protein